MTALASTTLFDGAGRGTMASSDASRSSPAPFQNDHEQWDVTDNSARPISYGRFNGPLDFPSDRRSSSPAGRGRARAPYRASGILSSQIDGSRRPTAQTLPHQQLVNSIADRLKVHPYRLSSSHSSRWIDPNENGLTNAKTSFASGANSDD